MCSRYELDAELNALWRRFSVLMETVPNRAEVRPTDIGLVLGATGAGMQSWGLKASWDGHPLINARCETLAVKSSFKGLLSSRVLVPATAWWEWDGPGRKVRLRPEQEDRLFAFAGLSDGERFTIVTCDAVPEMAALNDRMPVILPREAEAAWIDPALPFADAARWLRPPAHPLILTPEYGASPQLRLF